MKKCAGCKREKPTENYFIDIDGKPMSKCKTCIINGAPTNDRLYHVKHADALYHRNMGKKYKDIALEMGVPINTVKTWIRRARLNLLGIVPR